MALKKSTIELIDASWPDNIGILAGSIGANNEVLQALKASVMTDDNNLSTVTNWIDGLRQRDPEAQKKIWERFVDRLVRHANRKLIGSGCRVADGEDIASMAFANFFKKSPEEFERLVDRDDLWQILSVLADRRAIDQIRKESARKYGGGRLIESASIGGTACEAPGLDNFACREITPDFELILAEEVELRLDSLPDEVLRQVAVGKMEGFRNREIADKLQIGLRSVERKLGEIRNIFSAAIG